MITWGWILFSIHFKLESFYFYLVALDAFGGELVLIAASAVDVVLLRRQMSSQYSSKLKTPGLEMDTEDSLFITFGMKLLVPMGFLQVQQTKHFSCHCRLLYSIFFIPA